MPHRTVGIRAGEKIHEVLVTEDESRHAQEFDDHYAIHPSFPFWRSEEPYPRGRELEPGFRYSSVRNDTWLTVAELRRMVGLATVG